MLQRWQIEWSLPHSGDVGFEIVYAPSSEEARASFMMTHTVYQILMIRPAPNP
jgi:hypothetical protein